METITQRIGNEARAFIVAPVYPFLQRGWITRMSLFIALSYVPLVNLIVARGWRMEYVRRLGWNCHDVLPSPRHVLRYLGNGLLLWLAHGAFLLVPAVVIVAFGLGGWRNVWNDTVYVATLTWDYLWAGGMGTGEYLSLLWRTVVGRLLASATAFLIENIWLVVYVPVYRIGMIRFSLTGRLIRSHLAVWRNLRFLFRNFADIVLMYAFNVFNFVLVFVVDVMLAATVVGAGLVPVVTCYMFYWNSGYRYGHLARRMVADEKLSREAFAPRDDFAPIAAAPAIATA